ncbi:MAG: photosynthetic reaction center subunit H [Alphaproteobacteria bacterium]|nr:photosynthetic reaction center subunit H [Alphaproteobacteria bacterium]
MIFGGEFISGVDLVDIALWLFTLFFFGLVFYLQQESRREGYPLESDTTGKLEGSGVVWFPQPKTFRLPHGQGEVSVPHGPRDTRRHNLVRTASWAGAPVTPTGDPMQAGVGPGSYAQRMDIPDVTNDGRPRIVPMRTDPEYKVASNDLDPRGLTVYGADGQAGGVVKDLWIDQSEALFRYLEVDTGPAAGSRRVLLPITFAVINKGRKRVEVDAILGKQFAMAPTTKSPEKVTRLEEDKIAGFYGGGKLYATPSRTESLI